MLDSWPRRSRSGQLRTQCLPQAPTNQQLLQRIEALEAQLAELKSMVRAQPASVQPPSAEAPKSEAVKAEDSAFPDYLHESEVRRQRGYVLRLQRQSADRAREPASGVRRDEQQLQPEPGERGARERSRTSRPAVGLARASICSTARRPKRCRAAWRTSRGRGCTATSFRRTAHMYFRWAQA